MSDAELQRDIGRMEAQISALTATVANQTVELAAINKTLSEAKGGWKMFLMVGGFSAAVGGLVAKLLPFWQAKP